VARFADVAMYNRIPIVEGGEEMRPKVTLMHMTPHPLRQLAAASELYRGNVVHDYHRVDRGTALTWLTDMTKTVLAAPLEFVDIWFLIEGVTRAFTHQLVRQRVGAVYIQESMRFSVAANGQHEVRMPPAIERLKEDDPARVVWQKAVDSLTKTYVDLINAGIPAEDARGLLPTNIGTRIHYKTNLRGLMQHGGMRLTSQAQYEWKEVWRQFITTMASYGPKEERWQQQAIVRLFRPLCYHTGKCEFLAETDRYCNIRERVMAHHAKGEGPEQWGDIDPLEALAEGAARLSPQDA
jgi:flavin-dependent thymidylate synthase